jgi:hypothetical protein
LINFSSFKIFRMNLSDDQLEKEKSEVKRLFLRFEDEGREKIKSLYGKIPVNDYNEFVSELDKLRFMVDYNVGISEDEFKSMGIRLINKFSELDQIHHKRSIFSFLMAPLTSLF